MDELIQQIEDALVEFAFSDLCEGNKVRDVLLDLLMAAKELVPEPVGAISRDLIYSNTLEETNAP